YGFFNRISLYRVRVDHAACTSCGNCTRQCPMAVTVPLDPNTAECIRCGECAAVCPTHAIQVGFGPLNEVEAKHVDQSGETA
ncbi:MAG: 4Fe-4S dicluster domain-containing protein, partial [Clostridia bacterium]|nr:4Fe-4S dicluster domain-containing protein [Clostridia bacterium]